MIYYHKNSEWFLTFVFWLQENKKLSILFSDGTDEKNA